MAARPALAALLVALSAAAPALAGQAVYPAVRAPTEIARVMDLESAARAGAVQLTSKGIAASGDQVQITVTGKPVRAPIRVTVHVEFIPPSDVILDDAFLAAMKSRVEARLAAAAPATTGGSPVSWRIDLRARTADAEPRFGYHQITLVTGDARSFVNGNAQPNVPSGALTGTWELEPPAGQTITQIWAHEVLHLVGYPDHYRDVYKVGNKRYPVPDNVDDDDPAALAAWRRGHTPPIPPGGKIVAQFKRGTGPCDILGSGTYKDCAKLLPDDINWLAGYAGLEVEAKAGDLILNKSSDSQNFGVALDTFVFAGPGQTTTAEGLGVYCLDRERHTPSAGQTFDVLGPAAARGEPGMAEVARLLALAGQKQTGPDDVIQGMDNAIWAVTNGVPPLSDETRALLAEAGVPEVPAVAYPELTSPNAASPSTGGVEPGGVEPPADAPPVEAAVPDGLSATLYPGARLPAGKVQRGELEIAARGAERQVTVTLQRKAGKRWRARAGLRLTVTTGNDAVFAPVRIPKLLRGSYRLKVGDGRTTVFVPLTVR